MVFFRLCVGVIFSALLSGCYLYHLPENIDNLKGDVKLLKAHLRNPPTTMCLSPGTHQNILCSYRLVVQKIAEPNYYQGAIDRQTALDGLAACKTFTDELKKQNDSEWILRDYECQNESNYDFTRKYGFKIEGDLPDEGVPVDFFNIPGTGSLKKGTIPELKIKSSK